jgi:hypothetical protein
MTEKGNVITLHDGPPLNDIPAQLRYLADHIEAGTHEHGGTVYVVIPEPPGEDWPDFFIYGDHPGDATVIGHLAITLQMLTAHKLNREP